MPRTASFEDILIQELKNLHSAETQLLGILPALAAGASDSRLKTALGRMAATTTRNLARLLEASSHLRVSPRGKVCQAMKALSLECLYAADSAGPANLRDARLALGTQRVGHYKICGFESARTLARALAFDDVADLLLEALIEENATDGMLSDVAVELYTESDIRQIDTSAFLISQAS